jgi:hypothetical protein
MSNSGQSVNQELMEYVAKLHTEYEVWYAKDVRKYSRYWHWLQLLSILFGFATSVLAAFNLGGSLESIGKSLLIILPGLGALVSAILAQFRIFDLWRIREQGRISFQALHEEGKRRSATAQSESEVHTTLASLQERADRIEQEQNSMFFGLHANQSAMKFSEETSEQKPAK